MKDSGVLTIGMTIAVMLGTAFNKIIQGFFDYITMPILGYFTHKVDFSNIFISLPYDPNAEYATVADAISDGVAVVNFGLFLSAVLQFMVVAIMVYAIVGLYKWMNVKKLEEAVSGMKECEFCLTSIPEKAKVCRYCGCKVQENT